MRRNLVKLVAAVAAALSGVAMVAAPSSASNVRVDPRIFGLHDASLTSLAHSGVGSLRLWDTGVSWRELATYDAAGTPTYDWTRLDHIVAAARAKHVEVTLVLGQTPEHFSLDPAVLPGSAVAAYRSYVVAVMQRYGSRIGAYQVWNEANVANYWLGTPQQLARLTAIVHDARNRWAPRAEVVTAPLLTRDPRHRRWISEFAATRVDGRPVWRYADAVALNLYPQPSYGRRPGMPEDSIMLLTKAREVLHHHGWPKAFPVWATELNYGLQQAPEGGPGIADPVSDATQVAYVIRTWALDAAHGVKRVYWYSWDMAGASGGGARGNTLMTDVADHSKLTPAGHAFQRVQRWLDGTLVGGRHHAPCRADRHGTYTCTVRYAHSIGRIYWNPRRTARVRLVGSARTLQDQDGLRRRAVGRAMLKVGFRPVLVRSAH